MESKCLTRDELHALVWSKPMKEAGQEVGVSDVALAKACRKHGIPLPKRGYWLRSEPRSKPTALPKRIAGQAETITFSPPPPRPVFRPENQGVSISPIQVKTELGATSKLVQAAYKRLLKARVDKGIYLTLEGVLTVRTSPEQLERALLTFDAVIEGTEQAGGKWKLDGHKTTLTAFGGTISVELIEKRKQIKQKSQWDFIGMETVLQPTGLLAFRTGSYEERRAALLERPDSPMELKIGAIVQTLLSDCNASRIKQEEHREWKRQWDQDQADRQAQENAAKTDRILTSRLLDAARDHRRSAEIRALCDAVEARINSLDEPDLEALAWLTWAKTKADQLDPVLQTGLIPISTKVSPQELAQAKPEGFVGLFASRRP